MSFSIDMDGIETGSGGSIPEGWYNLRIVSAVEKVSKKGDPMVVVDYEIMDGLHAGRLIKFYYVVFFKDKTANGAGMSKHFLKTIGLPHEGKITVDPSQWIGRCVVGNLALSKGQNGKDYPRIKSIDKYVVDYTVPAKEEIVTDGEKIPF